MVLAVEPEAVKMGEAREEYPQFPPTYGATPIPLRQISASGVSATSAAPPRRRGNEC